MVTINWISLLMVMTILSQVSSLDPSKESIEILREIQNSVRSMESRLGSLETKLLEVNLVDHAFRMNNVNTRVEETSSTVAEMNIKVKRIDSILVKLQLTDQEKRKWCNTDYGQNLFDLHKTESETLRKSLSSMLTEIQELIRSGMGKLLVRMDSLLTEAKAQPSSSSEGSFKPASSISSSSSFPSPHPISSSSSTNSRQSADHGSSSSAAACVTLIQLNHELNTMISNLRSLAPTPGNQDIINSERVLSTTLARFRSFSEDTVNTMVKRLESAENQLVTTVLNALEVPEQLSQVKERIENNINKLRLQVDSLSTNAPILRILRHIKTQLPEGSRITCVDEQTSELLEKASNQVNTMINDYSREIVDIDHSLASTKSIVSRLNLLIDKYKTSYVQNMSSDSTHTSFTSSWE